MIKVTITGNLATDVKVGMLAKAKKKFANFTVAAKTGYTDTNGDYETIFTRCTAWAWNADFAEKLCKGDKVFVYGTLRPGEYQNSKGETVKTYSLTVDNMEAFAGLRQKKDDSADGEQLPF